MVGSCRCFGKAKLGSSVTSTDSDRLETQSLNGCYHLYEEGLDAQRALFAYAEARGVSVSEARLGPPDNFANMVTATATPGEAAREARRSIRSGTVSEQIETLYRPGTIAVEGRPLGRVLLLVAGCGSGIGLFAYTLPALVDYFEAIFCIDLAGFGLSSRWAPTRSDTVRSQFSCQLHATVSRLSRKETLFRRARTRVLGAHSAAAVVAVDYLGQQLEPRFHTLMLLSPIGVSHTNWMRPQEEELTRAGRAMWRIARFCARRKITPQAVLRAFLRTRSAYRFFTNVFAVHLTAFEADEEILRYLFLVNMAPCPAERSVYELLAPGDQEEALEKLRRIRRKTPIAFIVGDEDLVPYQVTSAVHQQIGSGVFMRVVNHTRHLAVVENVPQFAHEFIDTFREAMLWLNRNEETDFKK